MPDIVTLTLNPSIDVAYEVEELRPTHKMRAGQQRFDPGGGGLNVARIVTRLGGTARACYLAGGVTAATLDSLLSSHRVDCARIPIMGATRISSAVLETSTGQEYRFVPAGPALLDAEWQAALEAVTAAECRYVVASGSLPQGVPEDFYARLAERLALRGIPMILDTSGPALRVALEAGGLHLVKPSLGELEQLTGRPLADADAVAMAARDYVARGRTRIMAVTMGHRGAVLADASGTTFLPALPVEAKSAVGAGDSFVAAMAVALCREWSPTNAFRYAMAAGAAAVLTPGTDMCRAEDVERLYAGMAKE